MFRDERGSKMSRSLRVNLSLISEDWDEENDESIHPVLISEITSYHYDNPKLATDLFDALKIFLKENDCGE
ncbi:MAG TPA: hypothetical protein VIH61_02165 [Waddliaceae bacterium]